MKHATDPNVVETHPLSLGENRPSGADRVLLKEREAVSKILRLVIGVVIGIKGDIELLKVNILIEDDELPNRVGDWLGHPPTLRL